MYVAYYVTHPHWWIFSGGSALSSASRDDPLDCQPSSPVKFRVRPLATASQGLLTTGRYGWPNKPLGAESCSVYRYLQHLPPFHALHQRDAPGAGGPSAMGVHVDLSQLRTARPVRRSQTKNHSAMSTSSTSALLNFVRIAGHVPYMCSHTQLPLVADRTTNWGQ